MRQYAILLCIAVLLSFVCYGSASVLAEPLKESGGYLSAYQEPVVKQSQATSGLSMFAYLLSLVAVFAFIAFSAYIVSRFLGRRFGVRYSAGNGTAKVLESLPLGGNRSVVVVDIAGKVLLLGVTEQGITLLNEVEDIMEISRLREQSENVVFQGDFQEVFDKQLMSLEKLSKRVPKLFKERRDRR